MENDEKKLSDYIDRLNEEKKPEVHGNSTESPQMEELMKTVRKVRSLKEPALPGRIILLNWLKMLQNNCRKS